jgi:hypothetical protein
VVTAAPNPFRGGADASGRTVLQYTLTQAAAVSVVVRDGDGGVVRTLQSSTDQAAGTYDLEWDGVGDAGASLAEGAYTLAVEAVNGFGTMEKTASASYELTPVASQASLAVDAGGHYVLHTVVEGWSESLNGQADGDFYFDGRVQPWELQAQSGAEVALFVGADPSDQQDTSSGGSVAALGNSLGVADLEFPDGLAWQDAGGAPLDLYYSLRLTYGGSTRWYPAAGRYPLRPPVRADGHVKFAHLSDIQTPLGVAPTPDLAPSDLDAGHGALAPYAAIPRLSRSLGWSAVLAGLRAESDVNLVVASGDLVDLGNDDTAPDDGTAQLRSLFDNRQSLDPAPEWSLNSLTSGVAMATAPGNHDGISSSAVASRWNRWVYSPTGLPYYAFDQGDVHIVMVNTYYAGADAATNYRGWIGFQSPVAGGSRDVTVGGVTYTYTNSAQANWLIGALQTSKPWTVVVMHYPVFDASTGDAYSAANQAGSPTTANKYYYGERDRLLSFFAGQGVDVVLQGHLHYYRRHMEKVRSQDGSAVSAQAYVTLGLGGGRPRDMARSALDTALPYLDWVDLDLDGVPDASEPLATDADEFWDAAYFGESNDPVDDSGYFGVADTYHAAGQEYDDGLSFAYSVLEPGTDGEGAPALTLTVKRIAWNAAANAWGPWTIAESVQLPQVEDASTAERLAP